mmetsp:Transcript_13111/g.31012  ORF Transcript_13111/g.31012 Transcript_13111/m.31012 type:complete len:142 (-) Transcript_13111:288-713(-)
MHERRCGTGCLYTGACIGIALLEPAASGAPGPPWGISGMLPPRHRPVSRAGSVDSRRNVPPAGTTWTPWQRTTGEPDLLCGLAVSMPGCMPCVGNCVDLHCVMVLLVKGWDVEATAGTCTTKGEEAATPAATLTLFQALWS